MRVTTPEGWVEAAVQRRPRTGAPLRRLALAAVLLLAGGLRFANLEALGYANPYYTAGVVSMLQSWPNFFFVAAEPGGSVSIDKPPLGLWVQTLSAALLGVSGFAVVLPQLLAGIGSVLLLSWLVRRWYGVGAGLLAALALAVTPVAVATDRNNTGDSLLTLALLLAAWAFLKAAEGGRLRHLLLGAALVGAGFNIKMLQALLPLPALYGLYLLGAPLGLGRRLAHLALASALLLAVALAWPIAVDLTSADRRPYVGSSGDNSVLSLIIGYNGVERLLGGGGPPQDGAGGSPQGAPGALPGGPPQSGPGDGGSQGRPPAGPPGQGGPGNLAGIGQAGPLRLLSAPLSKELSWLLPFGALGAGLLALGARPRRPLARDHQALLLWGGWLLTGAIFFSVAGFFHEYYLTMLAPPLAALVGIGAAKLWRMSAGRPWRAGGLLLAGAAATVGFQLFTAASLTTPAWWMAAGPALLLAGGLLLARPARSAGARAARRPALAFAAILAAMLVTPGVWAGLGTADRSASTTLPSAYGGDRAGGTGGPGGAAPQIDQAQLAMIQAGTQDVRYLLAAPSSLLGAEYVIATGRPVLYIGGFNGQDQVATAADLARLVAGGELRYILWGDGGGPPGAPAAGQAAIGDWLTATCQVVAGAAPADSDGGGPLQLYDCRP